MPTQEQDQRFRLTKELVLGNVAVSIGFQRFLGQYISTLPHYIDDAQRDLGYDIYDRMLRDPIISSNITGLQVSVLSEGLRLLNRIPAPSMSDNAEEEARYKKGEEIRTEMQRQLNNLVQPLEAFLMEATKFLIFGHVLAEKTYEIKDGKLVLKKLAIKPRRSYRFVVSEYMDFLGVIAATDPRSGVVPPATIKPEDIILREKFFHIAFAPQEGDPRGSSLIRPAYNAWYMKQQVWPQYLKYLSQFGTPSIAATLPEGVTDVEEVDDAGEVKTDEHGNAVLMSAAEKLLAQVLAYQNGSAMVAEYGTEFDIMEVKGSGEAFSNAVDLFDRQITKVILISTRATMEAQYGSKADSGTAKDLMDTFAKVLRRLLEVAVHRDVIYPTVVVNYGEEIANEYCPFVSLSEIPRESIVETGNMIANMARVGMIHDSQKPGIDKLLALPERDFETEMADKRRKEEFAEEQQKFQMNLLSPAEDDDGGERDNPNNKPKQKPRNPGGILRK